MGLKLGEFAWKIELLREKEARAQWLTTNYVPMDLGQKLSTPEMEKIGFVAAAAQCGFEIDPLMRA